MRVFGNRYRAELMGALAAADEQGACLGDLAAARNAPASVYQAPIRALVEAGLAERLPRTPGSGAAGTGAATTTRSGSVSKAC